MDKDLFLNYNGNPIHYTESGFVNVTEMAKIFGKNPKDFFAYKQAEEYIQALSELTGIPESDLKFTVQGGNQRDINRYKNSGNCDVKGEFSHHSQFDRWENSPNGEDLFSKPLPEEPKQSVVAQGTFCHPKLALRFAQWLNPRFAVWIDGKILELLGYSQAKKETAEELISRALIAANTLLEKQANEIKALEEKAAAHERFTDTEGLFSFADAARILNFKDFGEKKLFSFCRSKGLLNSSNKPIWKFVEKGLFTTKIVTIKKGYAGQDAYPKTLITPKGLTYIRELIESSGVTEPNRKGVA